VPCLHHDDNQSCNLRAARSEQDGFWQKTWKIALSSALPSSPFRHSVRFRYRPSNSGSGSYGGLNVSGFRMLNAMVALTIVGSPLPDSHTQQI
jgi:hypothetical protein